MTWTPAEERMSDQSLPRNVHGSRGTLTSSAHPPGFGRLCLTRGGMVLALGLVVVAALVAVPTAAHTDAGAGHGHLYVALGDDSRTAAAEPEDRLSYRYEGTLVVQEDGNGTRFLRLSIPADSALQEFTAEGVEAANTTTRIEDDDAGRHALLVWDEGSPAPGTEIDSVVLRATAQADPRTSFLIRWPGLGHFDELAVRIEIPDDLTLSGGGVIKQSTSPHSPPGRDVWSTIDLEGPTLEVTVQPTYSGPDPALAHPPNPFAGWLILLGIALVSGGAWALGKKLEVRRNDRAR